MNKTLFIFAIILSLFSCRKKSDTLVDVNFDNLWPQAISEDIYFNTFGRMKTLLGFGSFDNKLSLVKQGEGKNLALKLTFDKSYAGPMAGCAWISSFDSASDATFSFRVKFAPDFDFRKGGKLLGIGGGKGNTGGKKPTGQDGWSCRFMFHEQGTLSAYVYFPEMQTNWGTDFFLASPDSMKIHLVPGQWYKLAMHITMNTPGKNNGLIECSVNDTTCLRVKNFNFRNTNAFAIDQFQFSAFFGGSDSTWAPRKVESLMVDDILVVRNK